MIPSDAVGLFAGAVALGVAHGIEPGHGWPVAASYALDQSNKWLYGFAASFLLGVGHLISSIAMVVVFFFFKRYFELTQINEPIRVLGVPLGGPVGIGAGILLILLGVREYFHGHSHSHGDEGHGHDHDDGGHGHSHGDGGHGHDHGGHSHDHDEENHAHGHDHEHGHAHGDDQQYVVGETPNYGHSHDDEDGHGHSDGHDHDHGHSHDHSHDHGHSHGHDHAEETGLLGKIKLAIPFVGGHAHGSADEAAERGLWGIAGFAFVLGFAHEEEFEIIAMCAGSDYCLSLMTTYALTVIAGIVALTLLLIAGYEHYEERVERYTDYLPVFSAAVLIIMGLGFISGLF